MINYLFGEGGGELREYILYIFYICMYFKVIKYQYYHLTGLMNISLKLFSYFPWLHP